MKEYSCEEKLFKNNDIYQKPSNHFNLRYLILGNYEFDDKSDISKIENYIDMILIKKI